MLNIPDLEKRWIRYKIKSSAKYFILPLLLMIVALGYNFLSTDTKSNVIQKEINLTTTKIITESKHKIKINDTLSNAEITTTEKNSTPLLSPSMDFINNFETYTPQTQQVTKKYTKDIQKKKTVVKSVPNIEVPQIATITITKQDTTKDIQNILQRFKKDKNPALSLFLAKKYYELGNYQKASRYALITNKLNKDIEDSWLVFSKSLVKMHQKDKAIKILQKYIANSHSTNAAVLLHDILSGEFQ